MRTFLGCSLLALLVAACGDHASNRAPDVAAQVQVTSEDTPLDVVLVITDGDGDPMTVTASAPAHGRLEGVAPAWRYLPDADFHGDDGFEVMASDGLDDTVARVAITVMPVNDAPDVADDSVVTAEDVAVAVAAGVLTGNDVDVDHDPLTVVSVGGASGGTIVLDRGVATFTPDADFHGLASFGYVVSDGTASVPATVRVQVGAVIECGDGELEGDEACDDHNLAGGDGCDASCQVETGAFLTTSPIQVSGGLACTVASSNGGRKVAADSSGNVYVVMSCAGGVHLAVSSDHGASYAPPIALGIAAPWDVAVAAGAPGVAHVAATVDGELWYSRTADGGASWSVPGVVGTTTESALSIVADGYQVWIAAGSADGVVVLRGDRAASTGWRTHEVICARETFELVVDGRDGHLVLISQAEGLALRASLDGGVSFDNPKSVAGWFAQGDFAAGGGNLFAASTGGLHRISLDEPTGAEAIDGLPFAGANQRSVGADVVGNVYVASATSGGVQLDRLSGGTVGFWPRTLAAVGHYPGVSALPTSEGAAVVYEDGDGAVYATIQIYGVAAN